MPTRRAKRPDGTYYRVARRQSLGSGAASSSSTSGGLMHRRRSGLRAAGLWFDIAGICLIVFIITVALELFGIVHGGFGRSLLIGSGAGTVLASAACWTILRA
jgi:hypothetical protein